MKIDTIEDLAALLGAHEATEESISRRVYKYTNCGAWAAIAEDVITKLANQEWVLDIRTVDGEPYLHRARPSESPWVGAANIPPELVEFVGGLELRDGRYFVVGQDEIEFICSEGDGLYDAPIKVTTSVTPVTVVLFGSIVEGVEQTTSVHEVQLPCDEKAIWNAIQAVEDEAAEIWNSTHGCEQCFGGETVWNDSLCVNAGPDDIGMRPVDENCPNCGGNGVVI